MLQPLEKIGSSLTKFITAPAIAAGTALSALAIKTANSVDEMADTALKLGLSLNHYKNGNMRLKF